MDILERLIVDYLRDPAFTVRNEDDPESEYNLSAEDFKKEELQQWAAQLKPFVVQKMMELLPGGILGRRKIVSCEMPNNTEVIQEAASRQCQNPGCNAYFCKKHNLHRCPKCGGFL